MSDGIGDGTVDAARHEGRAEAVAERLLAAPEPIEEQAMEDVPVDVVEPLASEPAVLESRTAPAFQPVFEPGFAYLAPEPLVVRTPNFADAAMFLVLLLLGLVITTGGLGIALHYHWFEHSMGLHNFDEASKSTPLALGTQLAIYLIALVGAVPFFRTVWGKGYFAGLHWHPADAFRLRYRLFWTALFCNVLAMAGNWLLPFPEHAPIDKLFGTSTDAWMLACFGVTIAPFFEEMIFRGFLLPAMATAWDWCSERLTETRPKPLDAEGNPVWSMGAMIFASLVVSAPFAMMHSAQVGQAWGPLLLLYSVSLILCTVRLVTKSLAASTLVHSAYNFLLFFVMLVETGGFRHMDKL